MSDPTEKLIRQAVRAGWRVRRGKHYVLYAPDGKSMVVCAVTGSDHRAYRNFLSRMRKAGWEG